MVYYQVVVLALGDPYGYKKRGQLYLSNLSFEVVGNPYFQVRYIASTQVYMRHTRQGKTPLSCGGGIYTP